MDLELNLSTAELIQWGVAAAVVGSLLVVVTFRRTEWFETFSLKTGVKHLLKPFVLLVKLGFVTSGSRGLNPHSLPFWCWLNALALVLLIITPPDMIMFSVTIGVLTFHFVCFVAALLVIDEETDIWNGLLTDRQSVFRAEKFIKNYGVLVASTVFVFLFGALSAWLWDATSIPARRLVETPPDLGCDGKVCSYLQYLIAVIYQIPALGWVLKSLGFIEPPVLTQALGRYLSLAIDFTTVTLIYGVFKFLVFQQKAINDLVVAFERANPQDRETIAYLRLRAERAPEYIVEKLFTAALRHPHKTTRKRYIAAILNAGFMDFSRRLLQHLHVVGDAWTAHAALTGIQELIANNPNDFSPDLVGKSLDALCDQRNGKFRKHAKGVQDHLDALFVGYIRLCRESGFAMSDRRMRMLFRIAVSGPPDVRTTAFDLAAQIKPVRLAISLVDEIDVEGLQDADSRALFRESLQKIETLVQDRSANWRRTSRKRLLTKAAQCANRLEQQPQQSEPDPVLNGEIDEIIQTLRRLAATLQNSLGQDASDGSAMAAAEPAVEEIDRAADAPSEPPAPFSAPGAPPPPAIGSPTPAPA